MKTSLLFVVLLVAALLSGCASWEKNLPLVNAEHFEYHRAGPVGGIGGTDLVVENLKVTETEVAADSIDATTNIPFVGAVRVVVKGYRRDRATPTTAPP